VNVLLYSYQTFLKNEKENYGTTRVLFIARSFSRELSRGRSELLFLYSSKGEGEDKQLKVILARFKAATLELNVESRRAIMSGNL
jgi:hypothetical protein